MTFIEIYENIVKYYPLGVNEFDDDYYEYSGTIRLQKIYQRKTEPDVYNKWIDFLKTINNKKKEILETETISSEVHSCFSAKFLLLKEISESLTYTKEVQVHISLLAPFYTLFGLDKVTINATDKEFDPILCPSPQGIYEPWFPLLRNKVESKYSGYKFLPYSFTKQRIKELYIAGADTLEGEFGSVFQAFFTSFNLPNFQVEGDIYYE